MTKVISTIKDSGAWVNMEIEIGGSIGERLDSDRCQAAMGKARGQKKRSQFYGNIMTYKE